MEKLNDYEVQSPNGQLTEIVNVLQTLVRQGELDISRNGLDTLLDAIQSEFVQTPQKSVENQLQL
jgi:hypothetical protein